VPIRDPICSVRDCERPTEGVLTIATAAGSLRFSACEDHGRRATQGEWLTYELLGSTYILGPSGSGASPAHYEPLAP